MKTQGLLRLPTVFFDDHLARELPTPEVLVRTRTHVYVWPTDIHLGELLSDAEYYADPNGPDMSLGFKSSARATANAIRKGRQA